RLQGDWSSDVCSSDLPFFPQSRVYTSCAPVACDRSSPPVATSHSPTAPLTYATASVLPSGLNFSSWVILRSSSWSSFPVATSNRSEERRVGKECRSRL